LHIFPYYFIKKGVLTHPIKDVLCSLFVNQISKSSIGFLNCFEKQFRVMREKNRERLPYVGDVKQGVYHKNQKPGILFGKQV